MPHDIGLIAVSQRVVPVEGRGEIRDALDQAWTHWLASMGLLCLPVPNALEDRAGEFLLASGARGVILSGGNNLAMPVYDGVPDGRIDDDAFASRDRTEAALVRTAIERGLPVLGCCRGTQFLHAFFGGRLQRLGAEPVRHVARDHAVEVVADATASSVTRLATPASLEVNSFHQFGITEDALPPCLRCVARSPGDATIEAFRHQNHPIVGLMWHPERSNPAAAFDRRLAESLFLATKSC
ncbi:MAG: gamma-glutamyl-gamma-aminobutyrate hydrolase family protein [Planctomycetaceae bacterium]|nr:gamma-glutamyl-gamma-aminobutyrate hydrolase family protein [Planctomycetaceae bacterium]